MFKGSCLVNHGAGVKILLSAFLVIGVGMLSLQPLAASQKLDLAAYKAQLSISPQTLIDELSPLLQTEKELQNGEYWLEVHYLIANAHYFLSQPNNVAEVSQAGFELASSLNNDAYQARFLAMLTVAYTSQQKQTLAKQSAEQSLALARNIDRNGLLMAEVLMLVGGAFYEMGGMEKALKYLVQASEIFRQRGSVKDRSEAMATIALIYDELGQPEQAIEYHLKSLSLIDLEENLIEASITYYNVALVYRNMGEIEKAKPYAELSLNYAQKAGDLIGVAYATYELAAYQEEVGEYEAVLQKLEQIIPVFEKSETTGLLIYSRLLSARVKVAIGMSGWQQDLAQAEKLVTSDAALKRKIALVSTQAKVYDMAGYNQRALNAYSRWVELNKAQLVAAQKQTTRQYQAMYELNEAEAENKLLQAQKKLAEAELQSKKDKEKIWLFGGVLLIIFVVSLVYFLIFQIKNKKRFKDLAMMDELTKTRNRRSINAFLNKSIAQSHADCSSLCIGMLDIDHFKSINDTYGHDVGDMVLKEVAQAMSRVLRSCDALGRWGGEEWLLVLPGNSLKHVHRVFERIQTELKTINVSQLNQRTVTLSMGAAALQQEDSVESLIKRADEALYRAKQNGRDQLAL
ncbi:diguanylate cyclase [Aliikangiella sp. IMCC44653]